MERSAFILRISPSGQDKVPEALSADQILIGWAAAEGLVRSSLKWAAFREIIRLAYYADESTMRKAGAAAGHMWRFIREMKPGDLVVVPYRTDFFVGEIRGPATYDPSKIQEDSAYRRAVRWLNNKKPIPRELARSPLISRMKTQGTSADATDLLGEICDCLSHATRSEMPTFQSDLQARLIGEVLAELRSGRMDSFGFERQVQKVLCSLGAEEARIIPRNEDKGADLVAKFRVAWAFQLRVAVQAKHWQADPPVRKEVVEQLIRGIEAEAANLGMVVTSGSISDEAYEAAAQYFEETGIKIELIDGEQFAKLIVEHGIRT